MARETNSLDVGKLVLAGHLHIVGHMPIPEEVPAPEHAVSPVRPEISLCAWASYGANSAVRVADSVAEGGSSQWRSTRNC